MDKYKQKFENHNWHWKHNTNWIHNWEQFVNIMDHLYHSRFPECLKASNGFVHFISSSNRFFLKMSCLEYYIRLKFQRLRLFKNILSSILLICLLWLCSMIIIQEFIILLYILLAFFLFHFSFVYIYYLAFLINDYK